ncbi:chromate transporter [Undibacterium fentianense]|uniref:Chromate transporter n=1 Tax=Undibacterium fentianense TaxID=2828728 RepID=A0A941E722_9BURK|nr:chromate transporter [Undibacterium fentianense]MBR7801779.1 chromate transporter [Undibacterium fentianense]
MSSNTQGATRNQPTSRRDLFWSFTILAMQGFGGVVAIVQRELVDKKKWMTSSEFLEEWAVAQVMPGPNVVNLAMIIGNRFYGLSGALSALAGMLCFPLVFLLLLALLYGKIATHPGVAGALRGMSAVAAGMIIASGLRLIPALKTHPLGIYVAVVASVLTWICIALFRLPLAYVLIVIGGISMFFVYRQLQQVVEDQ